VTLTFDPLTLNVWQGMIHRMSRAQALYQIWTKSNHTRLS